MTKTQTIELPRAALLKALTLLNSVIDRRNGIPILGNIAIRANGKTVTIEGTDLDITMTCTLKTETKATFERTLPFHQLLNACRIEAAAVTIDSAGKTTIGKMAFAPRTLPIGDFPNNQEYETPTHWSIPGADLMRLISNVHDAISPEETRYYLNGILFAATETGIRFVATDGHRLNFIDHAMDVKPFSALSPDGMTSIIVPAKTVKVMMKVAKGVTAVAIDSGPKGITISADVGFPVVVRSKIIDGSYPDYKKVIPANNDKIASVATSELLEAVNALAAVKDPNDDRYLNAIILSFNGKSLTMSRRDASFQITANYSGPPITIGFNGDHILDAAKVLGDLVTFKMDDGKTPTILTGTQGPTIVLMPTRI